MENEYQQTIIEFMMDSFLVSHQQSYEITRTIVMLDDFEIRDKWTGGIYKYLVEAKEQEEDIELKDQIEFEYPKEMTDTKRKYSQLPGKTIEPQAMIIKYETGTDELEKFKAQPYEMVVRIQKPLEITALVPLINELKRTMNEAFDK